MNKVLLIGRLGKTPEVKKVKGDLSVASFSVATSTNFNNKDGQRVEKTEWHNIKAFGPIADVCGKYLTTGRLVSIEGRNETSKYTDKDNIVRYRTEVIVEKVEFLGAAPSKQSDKQLTTVTEPEPLTISEDDGMQGQAQQIADEPPPF